MRVVNIVDINAVFQNESTFKTFNWTKAQKPVYIYKYNVVC